MDGLVDPVDVYTVEHLLQTLVVVLGISELVVELVGIIQSDRLFQPQFIGCMKKVITGKIWYLQADAGFCRHTETSLLGLFGDNDNDTVGTT